ncbi:GNAT family N-acetyltransferase [Streptococcus oricebi]|uniref:N-acetyltransferase n=1 Tax=Streptococcus oricebi TaxID=1547447 RepID=A0ABS5B303_9STRE|nr:GNAT family N-acetyltransferase [Streptococcus oricebi]MBP2622886.1 N-acetyltransferase [Streptococcus oricebi]
MKNIYQLLAEHMIIETDRLLLRPVTLDDAEEMFDYASDEENTRFVFARHSSVEDSKNQIARYFLSRPLGNYGIEIKESHTFIGSIDLHKLDEQLKTAAIGYGLNKEYWKQGYATEALEALLACAFEQVGMNKLIACYDEANPASGRVMAKAGMTFSHQEPYATIDKKEPGRLVTRRWYSLTREEYLSRNSKD